jgi:hypothetical protein
METDTINQIAAAATEAPSPASRGAKGALMTLIKVFISAALIVYILRQTHIAEIWAAMKSADATLLIFAFLLHGVGYVSSAYRWKLLLQAQKYDLPIPFLVQSLAAAVFFNNLLPSTIGGDAMRAYDTARRGVDKIKSIAIVVVDRFLGLFALMIFAVVALSLATELTGKIENLWLWSLLTFLGMALAAWILFAKKVDFNWLWNKPPFSIIKKPIKKMTTAFADFQGKRRILFWAMILSVILQLAVVVHYYLISLALDLPIPFVKFLVIVPISTFVMMIPISINAIGLRENVSVFFLTIYGASIPASVAFAWIAYGMVVVLGILGGVIYALRK